MRRKELSLQEKVALLLGVLAFAIGGLATSCGRKGDALRVVPSVGAAVKVDENSFDNAVNTVILYQQGSFGN